MSCKNVIVSLIFLGFSCFATGQILDDSTKQVYTAQTTKYVELQDYKMLDLQYKIVDTLISDFHYFEAVEEADFKYQNLGGTGTSMFPIFFEAPDEIGRRSGLRVFDPMMAQVESLKYFDTKSPYTSLSLAQGAIGRSLVDINYARSDSSNFSIGFNFNNIVTDKQLEPASNRGDRLITSLGYDLFARYETFDGKYKALVGFTRRNHNAIENGGIISDLVDSTSVLFGYEDEAKVYMREADLRDWQMNFQLFHQYYLRDNFAVYHQLNRHLQTRRFSIENLDGTAEGAYFDNAFIDSVSTYDVSKFREWSNEFGFSTKLGPLTYNSYYRFRNTGMFVKTGEDFESKSEHYVGGEVKWDVIPGLTTLNGDVQFLLDGYYKVNAGLEVQNLNVSVLRQLYKPDLVLNRFSGNHREWVTNFDDLQVDQLEGSYFVQLPTLQIEPGIKLQRLKNYTFFGTNRLPQQSTGIANVFQLNTKLSYRFLRNMNLKTEVIYTKLSGESSTDLSMPELFMNGQLYYENTLFGDIAPAQIGVNVHWKSDYYAMDYDVASQQFFRQNSNETENYWLVDVFANFQLKNATLFFKMKNAAMGLQADGYLITPFYTGQKRSFDFGFRWNFYD